MDQNESNLNENPEMDEMREDDDDVVNLVDNALLDYAETLEDGQRDQLIERLENDEEFYLAMSNTLSRMAMLIAAAAVDKDDAKFNKRRKLVLFESRNDLPEVKALRLHYLKHRDAVDMNRLLRNPEDYQIFSDRLQSFLKDYEQMHALGS